MNRRIALVGWIAQAVALASAAPAMSASRVELAASWGSAEMCGAGGDRVFAGGLSGLDWLERGKTLIGVSDLHTPPSAYIIAVSDEPNGRLRLRCERKLAFKRDGLLARIDAESVRFDEVNRRVFWSSERKHAIYRSELGADGLEKHERFAGVDVLTANSGQRQLGENAGFEGLAVAHGALYAAVERPLRKDGQGLVRVFRFPIPAGGGPLTGTLPNAYVYKLTEPMYVSELAHFKDDRFLVLERKVTATGTPAQAHVYLTRFAGEPPLALEATASSSVPKRCVVDLTPSRPKNPEALVVLGPGPDGKTVRLLIATDNDGQAATPTQFWLVTVDANDLEEEIVGTKPC